MTRTWKRARLAALAATACCLAFAGQAVAAPGGNSWLSAGGDRENTRSQSSESKISPATVGELTPTWAFSTSGDVSATPAVDAQRVYVPDGAGNLYAVDRKTGELVWQSSIPAYTGVPGDMVSATPAVADGKLVVGIEGPYGSGGRVLAVDKDTGELLWSTQVDTHPAAVITQSATVFDGVAYVGVASLEELLAALVPGYDCCSFRGSMNALDLDTGQVLWTTYTAPEGYPGNAVSGSSPAVDVKRGSVYIATGNNYDVPDDVLASVAAAGDDDEAVRACLPADDLFDSVVALDRMTGAVKWATKTLPYDAWNADCIPFFGDGSNCPDPAGPGYGFAQAPTLFTVKSPGAPLRELVGAGSTSGEYWSLDPDTGQVVWVTDSGPGGIEGGLQLGSAVDGDRVYTANANSDAVQWTSPDGTTGTSGFWSGLDAATGEILWQTKAANGGSTSGPVTTANGVVFGCSLDPDGYMYALDASTGQVLWDFASGPCVSGAAISKGSVYWGAGLGTPNNTLYAFGLD